MTAKQIFIDTELRQETELRLRKLLPLMQREGLDAILVGSIANATSIPTRRDAVAIS